VQSNEENFEFSETFCVFDLNTQGN